MKWTSSLKVLLIRISQDRNRSPVTEASRAYKQAAYTLSTMTANPPQHTFEASFVSGSFAGSQKSIFSSLMPTLQGRGPIGSAVRIVLKLQHELSNALSSFSTDTFGSKKGFEDSARKAIKVLDLLQHSADLGSMEALYTLGRISLVSQCFCLIQPPVFMISVLVSTDRPLPIRPSSSL